MFIPEELQSWLKERGEPQYRYEQVIQAIFKEGKTSFTQILTLPKALRESLEANFQVSTLVKKVEIGRASCRERVSSPV